MIKARFVKAYPTEDGITYTLKGEKSKNALRVVADLQDEECIISLDNKEVEQDKDEAMLILVNMIREYGNLKYQEGLKSATVVAKENT